MPPESAAVQSPSEQPGAQEQQQQQLTSEVTAWRRGHSARKHARRRGRERDRALKAVLSLPTHARAAPRLLPTTALPAGAWEHVPASCDPGHGGRLGERRAEERAGRKRAQVLSFAAALRPILDALEARDTHERPVVVEFGSGSGSLVLALAHRFPSADFVAVEMKAKPVELLLDKARQAGLSNVSGRQAMIERFEGRFDVALALHACGNATDYAMEQAARVRAAYVVAPCCIGKLRYSLSGGTSFSNTRRDWTKWEGRGAGGGGDGNSSFNAGDSGDGSACSVDASAEGLLPALSHPRSRMLGGVSTDDFAAVAKLADCGGVLSACGAEEGADAVQSLPRVCKLVVEADRQACMAERGYKTLSLVMDDRLHKMPNKADMLVGTPSEMADALVHIEAQLIKHVG